MQDVVVPRSEKKRRPSDLNKEASSSKKVYHVRVSLTAHSLHSCSGHTTFATYVVAFSQFPTSPQRLLREVLVP